MSYLDFFRLQAEPFSNAPNERFYYNSAQHARALTRIMYSAETMKGLAVVVGDIGTGKTTLARKVLDSLPDEVYESALLIILHSEISPGWLLRKIATQLGVEQPAQDKIQIIGQLYRRLLQLHERGKRAVVLIDEAQMLNSRELMEEFRGLLNLEVTAHKLITFIFFGLPDIEENLQLDPPLLQRVAMKIRLSTLTEEATRAYVTHRLAVAGIRDEIFTEDALEKIYSYSAGFPRKINVLCDNALFQGFLMRKHRVDGEIVQEMAFDLGFEATSSTVDEISSLDVPAQWIPEKPPAGSAVHAPLPDEAAPPAAVSPVAMPDTPGPAVAGNEEPPSQVESDDIDAQFDEFFKETFKGEE
ncbi:MAG: AAA family ATPase [bacterium]|nr:MAG: AAA family ATPase [bacterium]